MLQVQSVPVLEIGLQVPLGYLDRGLPCRQGPLGDDADVRGLDVRGRATERAGRHGIVVTFLSITFTASFMFHGGIRRCEGAYLQQKRVFYCWVRSKEGEEDWELMKRSRSLYSAWNTERKYFQHSFWTNF